MAPARKTREMDYSNIGKQGRKTGITVKDTGARDEDGLELMDGLFSSPEKSSRRVNGATNNTTLSSEEDMELVDSTVPEPTDVLTERQSGRPILPLPRSRSPIKTSLNSAARRSVGPISSPSRPVQHTPVRAASHPAVNRRLDFSIEEVHTSIERSPQKGPALGAAANVRSTTLSNGLYSDSQPSPGRSKKRPFSLRANDDEESISIGNGATHETNGTAELDYTGDTGDDSMQIVQGDGQEDSLPEAVKSPEEKSEDEEPAPVQPPKRKGGRPRKLVSTELQEAQVRPIAARQGRGRPPKSDAVDIDASQVSVVERKPGKGRAPRAASVDIDASQDSIAASKPGRGRPLKNPKLPVLQDMNGDDSVASVEEGERPSKRAKNASASETPRVGRPAKKTKPPPSQRDPNAKVTSVKKAKAVKAASVEPEIAPRNNGRPKPRSLQIIRSGTPADDSGSRTTRSGRTSVKPLAYWRNERIVYGEDETGTKERYLLPTIKEVIRTEDVEPARPKKGTKGRSKAVGRKRTLEDVEEEDAELEPWETEEGIMRGIVRAWHTGQLPDDEDGDENAEIAYAHSAIQTREVHNSTFRYAKTLTLPFFGSGMVDLPPKGQKKKKNSRKMQMVFFVFYGRVVVEVAGNVFSIGKGGMWQVPRGNMYSITNQSDQPARIFFAQGCEVLSDQPSTDAGPSQE